MKYTPEITTKIAAAYKEKPDLETVAALAAEYNVPDRSIIAKLSSLGIYQKKTYLTKRGEVPVKKDEYIDRIAALLDVNLDMLESLEKVNKSVLVLLEKRLKAALDEE